MDSQVVIEAKDLRILMRASRKYLKMSSYKKATQKERSFAFDLIDLLDDIDTHGLPSLEYN